MNAADIVDRYREAKAKASISPTTIPATPPGST